MKCSWVEIKKWKMAELWVINLLIHLQNTQLTLSFHEYHSLSSERIGGRVFLFFIFCETLCKMHLSPPVGKIPLYYTGSVCHYPASWVREQCDLPTSLEVISPNMESILLQGLKEQLYNSKEQHSSPIKRRYTPVTQESYTVGREGQKHLECDGDCLLWVSSYMKQSYKGGVRTKEQCLWTSRKP